MSAPNAIPSGRNAWKRWRTVGLNLAAAACLLFALTFLPPDNSLADVQRSGVLRVCVPESMPPLVTTNAAMPGYDLAMLELIAEDLGVRLAINRNAAIGADFNPRNWRLTRAQCQIIAGGVVDNDATRGFLELLPSGLQTGWAMAELSDGSLQENTSVAVYPGPTALDRLALSRYLRAKKFRILPASSAIQLERMLLDRDVDVIISDRLTLSAIDLQDVEINWVSETDLGVFDLAFGLWKGDATLLRAVTKSVENLVEAGMAETLAAQYDTDADARGSP